MRILKIKVSLLIDNAEGHNCSIEFSDYLFKKDLFLFSFVSLEIKNFSQFSIYYLIIIYFRFTIKESK